MKKIFNNVIYEEHNGSAVSLNKLICVSYIEDTFLS